MELRIGQGYDLHRLIPGRPLLIGGVAIESPVGSDAHSDGDVFLHALIDALLGATGLGDIGDHFPPSDPQYKNISSLVLLQRIMEKLSDDGWRIHNVDGTVFLEKPKLYPYKQQIREQVADALGLSVALVSFKAKTAEGFPPVGTQEAIASGVTILVSR